MKLRSKEYADNMIRKIIIYAKNNRNSEVITKKLNCTLLQ